MKRFTFAILIVVVVLFGLAAPLTRNVAWAATVTSDGNTYIHMGAVQTIDTPDNLQSQVGVALSLTAADLNTDGASDLIAGYAGESGGWLAIYPANLNSRTRLPFLPQSQSLMLSHAPTWLGSGDFNADGFADLVAAGQNVAQLTYLLGDGAGGLAEPRAVALQAGVTALTVGELDRQDGLVDVVVGLEDGRVLVFTGGPDGPGVLRRSMEMPGPAVGLAIGQLDEQSPYDLAIIGGSQLRILHGQDQLAGVDLPPAQIDAISLGFTAASFALGDFQADDSQSLEIAVLSSAGSLHLYNRSGQALTDSPLNKISLPGGGLHSNLLSAKSSTLPGDDLLLLDSAGQTLQFFNANHPSLPTAGAQLASLSAGGAPRVALSLPLNGDALNDLVFLTDSASGPQYVLTDPVHVFVVNVTWDLEDDNIGNGKCNAASFLDGTMCSLRAAIQEANASPGLDEIQLSFRYSPASPLPQITEALTLSGTSGAAEINGSSAGSAYGLHFTSGSSTVRDLIIREFQYPAIYMQTGGSHLITRVQIRGNLGRGITIGTNGNQLVNNVIAGNIDDGIAIVNGDGNVLTQNLIGLFANDVSGGSNHDTGIYLWNADNTIIGGAASNRNVISGNWDGGIHITGGSSGTLVQSNYIGTKVDGIQYLGNDGRGGVDIENAAAATIGGATTAYRNVIGANRYGVTVRGNASPNNLIRNNYLGVNVTGTAALRNSSHAVQVSTTGGSNAVQILDNIIGGDGNNGHGVLITGQANPAECVPNVITNNTIGSNAALSVDLGVGMDGIHIEGVRCANLTSNKVLNSRDDGIDISGAGEGTATLTSNVLAGNHSDGIQISTDFNILVDNSASGNLHNGIQVYGDSNELTRNAAFMNTGAGIAIHGVDNFLQGPGNDSAAIWGNSYEGLVLTGDQNTVLYTHITSNGSAGVSISGDNNLIGGEASGNFINGNAYGVEILSGASGNQVIGNSIGVEANGVTGAGNAFVNILIQGSNNTIGGSTAGMGNIISDAPVGILIQNGMTGITIRNNKIGTNAAGTGGLGNTAGIKIENGSNNTITENQIAYNGEGVLVAQGTGNRIVRNSIYNSTRLGIDLLPAGVTANDDGDPDSGANNLQNYPVLTAAGISGGQGHIQGSFAGAPNSNYTFDLFSVPACDSSGYGEGQTYWGQSTRTTDANGIYTFDFIVGTLTLNQYATATVTDANGNTSEFSRCVKIGVLGGAETFTVNSTADAVDANLTDGICDSDLAQAGEQCTLRAAVQQANANTGANTILLPGGEYMRTRAGTDNTAINGDLDITGDLTISGTGANVTIVNASGLDRVFEIRSPAVVVLSGLTIQNGNPGNSAGGGIYVNSGAALTLDAVTVQDNQVGASAGGGGIYNQGALTVTNSAIINNQAGMNGGGLYQFGGSSTWKNSTFSGNQSASNGGAIAAENTTVHLGNVSVAYNTADSDSNGGDGGGLYQTGAAFSMQNSIIAHNQDLSPGIYPHGLADCAGAYASIGYNLISDQAQPSALPAGCTLTGGTGDTLGGFWLMSNYVTYSAGLGALQLNGGTTPSHSPVASGSGATVDWGSPAVPGAGGGACEPIDQRGQPRPLDGGTDGIARCDRGAVEHIPVTASINDVSVAEGGVAEFDVRLSAAAQMEFTMDYVVTGITALAGTDFQAVQGTLTFQVGATLQHVQVTTLNDTYSEVNETFRVDLLNPQYIFIADGQGIGTILDSDPQPSLLINDVSTSEGAAGQTAAAAFTVTLNSPSGKQVSVAYSVSSATATAGEDFIQGNGMLTFAPGVTSRSLVVSVLGDNLQEGAETYTVSLANPVNASLGDPSGTGTIIDDDVPALSIQDAVTQEGDSGTKTLYFSVYLSLPSTGEIRVNYITSPGSAYAASDYIHTSGTLIFAPGETAQTIPVSVVGDTVIEPLETFTVSLNTPTGGAGLGDASAVGSIQDNDGGPGSHIYIPFVRR